MTFFTTAARAGTGRPFSPPPRVLLATASVLFAVLLLAPLTGQAQDVGTLPPDVPTDFAVDADVLEAKLGGEDAIFRVDAHRIVVKDTDDVEYHVRRVVTVLTEKGRDVGGVLRQSYDSFRSIDDLDARVYDSNGDVVEKLDDEHLGDYSGSGGSLYQDSRIKIARLYHDSYPYTVEYTYTVEYEATLFFPTWYPQKDDAPVQYGHFEVDAPTWMQLRTNVQRSPLEAETRTADDRVVTRWTVRDLQAYNREPYGPSYRDAAPSVQVAPTQFEIGDSAGSMATWELFGNWYHTLQQGRQDLSADAVARLRDVVKGATTKRDSVRRLYRHLQQKTRYVSVQLGIGGFQSFPASYVEERSYGDCKALTNYMQTSLAAVGIESFPVLIYGGSSPPPMDEAFPANRFNHVVLAVPTAQDTLWLENTSQTSPFGHVSLFIENRKALLTKETGSHVVHTPISSADDNLLHRTARVALKANGNARATVSTTYTGIQAEYTRAYLAQTSPRDRMKWLRRSIDVSTFDVTKADFSDADAPRDTISLPYEMKLPRFAAKTGSRLFVGLNLTNRRTSVPDAMEDVRTQTVHATSFPYVDVDTVRFEIPDGYRVEARPDDVTLETEFSSYSATTSVANGELTYVRRIRVDERILSPDLYGDFRDFFAEVARADAAKAVLVKSKS